MQYRIGVYIRLSLADEDTGKSKSESDSVGNQRMLINHFLDGISDFAGCPRLEFVDDGFTGTNFRRPQFTRMMDLVRAGEINVICVKDFSRFSRDYIETGDYLECVFPFLGVRFISINDGYDSDNYKGTTGGMEMVMRNIIYASYSKDLSIKTTTAKLHMMKQGKYVGGFAPYGYTLHPTIRNKMAVDPEAAAVVRRIFDEALNGKNTSCIAKSLNDDDVPTPGQYFRSHHPDCNKFRSMSEKTSWTAPMVYKVLTKYVYTGATVAHTRKSAGIGTRKTIAQKPEDWIIVDGMHEAIVTKEEFELAQAVIRGCAKVSVRKSKGYPLKGLVRCGNCRRVMTRLVREKSGMACYHCAHSVHDSDTECALKERYEESRLEADVFDAIRQRSSLMNTTFAIAESGGGCKTAIEQTLANLRQLQVREEQLKRKKLQCYEQYSNGSVSKADYLRRKAEIDREAVEVEEKLRREELRMQELESERAHSKDAAAAESSMPKPLEHLTFDLAHAFLDAVYIHPGSRVELAWKSILPFEES